MSEKLSDRLKCTSDYVITYDHKVSQLFNKLSFLFFFLQIH